MRTLDWSGLVTGTFSTAFTKSFFVEPASIASGSPITVLRTCMNVTSAFLVSFIWTCTWGGIFNASGLSAAGRCSLVR